MPKIAQTIRLLKQVISDPNCERMNLSTVKGYLGELMVKNKLEQEGYSVDHKGNMSGHDLEVPELSVQIDVKFSMFKSEVRGYPKYWGWALKSGSKKRELRFSHFVLVALKENLEPHTYYVIKTSHLENFPENFAHFTKVEKGFGVFPHDLPAKARKKDLEYMRKSKKLLKTNKVVRILPRESLSKALKEK